LETVSTIRSALLNLSPRVLPGTSGAANGFTVSPFVSRAGVLVSAPRCRTPNTDHLPINQATNVVWLDLDLATHRPLRRSRHQGMSWQLYYYPYVEQAFGLLLVFPTLSHGRGSVAWRRHSSQARL
jgi:hypothetical protein